MEIAVLAVAGAALLAVGPAILGALEQGRSAVSDDKHAAFTPPDDILTHYPAPFGQTASTLTLGTAAAPLLAGFSVALIGLILQVPPDRLEEPDLALLALVVAVLLLIAAQQAVMRAQRMYIPPNEWADWLSLVREDEPRKADLNEDLKEHLRRHVPWLRVARNAYNAGIVLLLLGVAIALVPEVDRVSDIPLARALASCVAALGAAAELVWVLVDEFRLRRSE